MLRAEIFTLISKYMSREQIDESKPRKNDKPKITSNVLDKLFNGRNNFEDSIPPIKPGELTEKTEKPVKLTKSGNPDKRSITSKQNVVKANAVVAKALSVNAEKVKEALSKAKNTPDTIDEVDEVDETDDETDFEILQVSKPIPLPIPEIKRIETETPPLVVANIENDWITQKKQIEEERKIEREELKKQAEEQVKLLREENKRLKNLGDYNSHLSRISHLSRNVNLMF